MFNFSESPSRGVAATVTIDKNLLAALDKVSNDEYYSQQSNWKRIVVTFKSNSRNQVEVLSFNALQDSPAAIFLASSKSQGDFLIDKIIIEDCDEGYLAVERSEMSDTSSLDVILSVSFDFLQTLTSPDADTQDEFGFSVAIDGDYMVVAAVADRGFDDDITNAGEAYVFKKDEGGVDNWGFVAQLNSPNQEGSRFGFSVAIDGDYIVVGALIATVNGETGAGEAYVFKKDEGGVDNWGLVDTLVSDNPSSSEYFGFSVAIDGSYIVVGAYGVNSGAGEAYVFKNNGSDNWGLVGTPLVSDNPSSNDRFGYSVAISGDYIVVGAWNDDGFNENITDAGEAYVFKNDGADNWGFLQKLNSSSESTQDYFGFSVAIDGDYIVVGAYNNEVNIENSGTAEIFKKNDDGNWENVATLVSSNPNTSDRFGASVSISGDYIVVGAYADDGTGDSTTDAGEAYVFKKDGSGNWEELNVLNFPQESEYDYFGASVSISGDHITVGAKYVDIGGTNTGAVYIYKK